MNYSCCSFVHQPRIPSARYPVHIFIIMHSQFSYIYLPYIYNCWSLQMDPVKTPAAASSKQRHQVLPEPGQEAREQGVIEAGTAKFTLNLLHCLSSGQRYFVFLDKSRISFVLKEGVNECNNEFINVFSKWLNYHNYAQLKQSYNNCPPFAACN